MALLPARITGIMADVGCMIEGVCPLAPLLCRRGWKVGDGAGGRVPVVPCTNVCVYVCACAC